MPPSTEQIPDQPGFNVYAMMLILSFVFTAGASYLLNDDLTKHWGFWDKEKKDVATSITQLNDNVEKHPELVSVRDKDYKEWELAKKHLEGNIPPFPVSNWKWPEGFKPLENPIDALLPQVKQAGEEQLDPIKILIKDREAAPAPTEGEKKPDEPKDPSKEPAKEPAPPAVN